MNIYTHIYTYIYVGSVYSVMVIVRVNGNCIPSSNPRRGGLYFTLR